VGTPKRVDVTLSAHGTRAWSSATTSTLSQDSTLVEAIVLLDNPNVDTSGISLASGRMRSFAFNSERLLNALALAVQTTASNPGVVVLLPAAGSEDVVSTSLAMVLLESETNSLAQGLEVVVSDESDAREAVGRMVESVRAALGAGCKAVSLGEACLVYS
jgi:hypothetical protein